jgi:hypothetical protein
MESGSVLAREAVDIEVSFDPDRYSSKNPPSPDSPRYWSYLTSFLPAGALKKACRTIQKTGGLSGPARACLFSYGKNKILVAQYLTTAANFAVGTTALGEGFDWVTAGH